jgi:hypothetical protein
MEPTVVFAILRMLVNSLTYQLFSVDFGCGHFLRVFLNFISHILKVQFFSLINNIPLPARTLSNFRPGVAYCILFGLLLNSVSHQALHNINRSLTLSYFSFLAIRDRKSRIQVAEFYWAWNLIQTLSGCISAAYLIALAITKS